MAEASGGLSACVFGHRRQTARSFLSPRRDRGATAQADHSYRLRVRVVRIYPRPGLTPVLTLGNVRGAKYLIF